MSGETLPQPERRLTTAQEESLRTLCEWYQVEYAPDHYYVHPADDWMMPGYATGWLGGNHHVNPAYGEPEEPRGKATIYVGCSPTGEVSS